MSEGHQEGEFRVPLIGCDGFLHGLEDLMACNGQGRHVGLTVLKLGSGFCIESLRNAAARFSQEHPLLHAVVERSWLFGIPEWRAVAPFTSDRVRVVERPPGVCLDAICNELLLLSSDEALRLDVIVREDGVYVVARWLHLLFDGRGIELALAEIGRLAERPDEPVRLQKSWGAVFQLPKNSWGKWRTVRGFVERYNALRKRDFESMGGCVPRPGRPQFRTLHFDATETATIKTGADDLTGGIFVLPYFFAVVVRAHAAVFVRRGKPAMSFYASAPVQLRKRGDRHPIFQNQISQFYFELRHEETVSLEGATKAVHSQFGMQARGRLEASFLVMLQWLLRLPERLYLEFLRRDTGGHIVSFFQSHTGQFMPETQSFCGALLVDGWHIPTVSRPPGTGIFFSERNGCLSATISWRDGVVTEEEVEVMCGSLRQDFLGERK